MSDATFNITEIALIMLGPLAALAAVVYRFVIKPKAPNPQPNFKPTQTPLSDNLAAREATRAETIRESDGRANAKADGPSVPGSDPSRVAELREWAESDD